MKQILNSKVGKILFSYWTMLFLFSLLAIGAAVATFIENDYGTATARVLVYNHIWYETVLTLTIINLIGIMLKHKMWKNKGKFIFHLSFIVMLIGAAVTRYVGYEGIMHIREGQTQNKMISSEAYFRINIQDKQGKYYQEFKKEFSAIGNNNFNYNIKFNGKILNIKLVKYTFAKKGSATMNLIETKVTLGNKSKIIKLIGQSGNPGITREVLFKDCIVHIAYGSKDILLPFGIKLRDFELQRYAGSMAPSSYASEVTLIDKANNVKFDFRIFMNHVLNYKNYRFFQSSYDPDEKGTVLSVNHDPGGLITYIGYFLLTLGLLMNLFEKNSRFTRLTKYIQQFNSLLIFAISFAVITPAYSATTNNSDVEYLKEYKTKSLKLAEQFGKLVVQSGMGRMKPIDTLSKEIVLKLSKKSSLMGLNHNQIVLGMLTRPDIWQNIKMLKIRTPKLKKELHIDKTRKLVAFSEMFDNHHYKLASFIEKANRINPNKRGTFDRDVIKLDERINIAYMVYTGDIFKILPKPNDKSKKWYNPTDAMTLFAKKDKDILQMIIRGFISNTAEGKYNEASKYLQLLSKYQQTVGKDIIPSKNVIDKEILFNKLDIFFNLTLAYMAIGILLFILSFITVFNSKLKSTKINNFFFVLLAVLLLIHTAGMGLRWYISGHAPWSNTYESLVYIAWSTMFAGVVFFRKSLMALAATVVMAGVFMFTAHLTGIDPQITNLVPVLKSYWLTIHVSIITGSYGFLAVGAMLGLMALVLFIFRSDSRPELDKTIKHITAINEAALIIGLSALIVGNFIGGVWANESWGRYWGWDPKETWAYVSIIVYSIVIHLRLIKKLDNPFVFATASTLAFSSILMTYFGVNFYLSGMHSYATGDPVPIPNWVYILTTSVFILIAIASRKKDLSKIRL